MTGNYSGVDSSIVEYGPEDAPGEPGREIDGELEEMYVDNGNLVIIIVHEDGETVSDIEIPIQAKESWSELVESLPRWK